MNTDANTEVGVLLARVRLNFQQSHDWRAAMRLNFSAREPATFSDLRRIYRAIKGGAQYGRSSGLG